MGKVLGLISGCGSVAGVHMAQRLVKLAQERGAKQDSDFPEFYLYNLPFGGTDEQGITDPKLVLSQLRFAVEKMSDCRCDYLLICCNTFHSFIPELAPEFSGKILSMIDLAADAVMGCNEVGIICSRTSKQLLLYETALNHHRIRPVVTTDEEQDFLDMAIGDAICGNRPEKNWKGLHCLIDSLHDRGAERVIGGCTELPICLNGHVPGNKIFVDAGEVALRHALTLL